MEANNYTEKTQQALIRAQRIATERGNPQIEPEHMLLALLEQSDGVVPRVVLELGVDPQRLRLDLEQVLARKPRAQGAAAQVAISPALLRVLQAADREAQALRDEYISTEHILLALADTTAGEISRYLAAQGISREAVLRALTGKLPPGRCRRRPRTRIASWRNADVTSRNWPIRANSRPRHRSRRDPSTGGCRFCRAARRTTLS